MAPREKRGIGGGGRRRVGGGEGGDSQGGAESVGRAQLSFPLYN